MPTPTDTSSTPPSATAASGVVNAPSGINLRQSGNLTAPIVAKLPKDTALVILDGQGTDWLHVRVQASGQTGYAFAQYVTLASAPASIDTGATEGASNRTIATPGTSDPGTSDTATTPTTASNTPIAVAPGFLVADSSLMAVPLVPARILQPLPDGSGSMLAGINNRFGGFIATLAARLTIPASVVVAVLAAESGGRTGDANGRMIIRFEVHVFYDYWGKANETAFNQFFTFNQAGQHWTGHQFRENPTDAFQDFHGNQDLEWKALGIARRLSDTDALFSISMGAPQVMGFNYKRLGYNTVQDMFTAFTLSPRAQLVAIFDFVRGTTALDALRSGDYLTFARAYNGPGNAQTYANIISTYKARFESLS